MKRFNYIWFLVAGAITSFGCRKPYAPKAISGSVNYLVVEGVINCAADDMTYIKLSRMVPLMSNDTPKAEHNAVVTIEGDDNSSYMLADSGNGIYEASLGGLATTGKYRLRIKTSNNEEYLSDYVPVKVTPPIDSLSYSVQNGGVEFYVNAHDPTGNTRYYRWDFDETFGYFAYYHSLYKVGQDSLPEYIVNQGDKIYECYKTLQSQTVALSSSAKLAKDEIYRQPVDFITQESGKISHGYSLLLRQYALTPDAYNYWQTLKRNTEQIGTIFDVQPSEAQGNIHCLTNPLEPVVGYISASSVTTKRIYLDTETADLFIPPYLPPPTPEECLLQAIMIQPKDNFAYRLHDLTAIQGFVLVDAIIENGVGIVGYHYAPADCADCRVKAPYGTNQVPAFWPPNEHE